MKYSKLYAHYRPADTPTAEKRCGTCASMNDDGTCRKVEGKVSPTHVCSLWTAKRK